MTAEPLAADDCLRIIRLVAQRGVLVAGQAVAWWAEYYAKQGRLPEISDPRAMYVSKDIDFLASCRPDELDPLLSDLAKGLPGRVERNRVWSSLVSAVVMFRDAAQQDREVDLLRDVHGAEDRNKVRRDAIQFGALDASSSEGPPPVLVMDPVTLFETRVANVVELEKYRDEKGVQQARIAGAVLREWHRDQLTDGWPAARRGIKRTLRLAQSRHGILAVREYGLDVLGCIPAHPNLDPNSQQLRRAQERVASAIAAARAPLTS